MNTPNTNMNSSPLMLDPQQPENAGGGSGEARPRRLWPGFLGLMAGLFVGGVYFSKCPKVYKSEATVVIQLREERIFQVGGNGQSGGSRNVNIRHDQLIGEDNILTSCLVQYGLSDLATLRDLPLIDQIKKIQDNLVVIQNRDEPTKYELEYSALNAVDAEVVLAVIVSVYEKHLNDAYPDRATDTMESLQKKSYQLRQEVKSVNKKLRVARDRAEELMIAGNTEHIQRIVAACLERIEGNKTQLAEFSADIARSEAALESGREACLEYIWILEEADKISRNSLQIKDNSLQLSIETKMIEELERQRDQLDEVDGKFGPSHGAMEDLSLAIIDRKEKVKELTSAGAKFLAISPEQIVQRFAVSVKQQIDDLRLSLGTDFSYYKDCCHRAAKSERAKREVDELIDVKLRVMNKEDAVYQQIIEQKSLSRTKLHRGFYFETVQPAYRGREVWPTLTRILPVTGLLGSLLGLGFGSLVKLAEKIFY